MLAYMNIIVAGCGKVGTAVIESLEKEGHKITAIDVDKARVDALMNIYDLIGVFGNAADSDVLTEAGVASADLYIAAAASDELNMLSCFFARRLGAKHTIARVRNAGYNDSNLGFIRQQLELSMSINPELTAAREIFNVLKLPSAIKIETFSNRSIEMVEFKLKEDSRLSGMRLSAMREHYKKNAFLVATVQRGEEVYIPDGNFTLQSGDKLGVLATPLEIQKFFQQLHILQKQARNVMILGGSRTAYYLAKRLASVDYKVKIIDQDRARCENLAELLPACDVICGNGADQDFLQSEGIRSMDAVVSLTGMDEENILFSFAASSMNVPKVITKVNSSELRVLAERLGLETIISPKSSVAEVVTRYARALQNSTGSNVETLYQIAQGKAEVLEFKVRTEFIGCGIPLRDLKLKRNVLIGGIVRGRRTIIPTGADDIRAGDKVVVIAAGRAFHDLSDILA